MCENSFSLTLVHHVIDAPFQAGIILCCLGCAIFGITEVPTDGVDFDTGDFDEGDAHDVEEGSVAAPVGTHYEPPQTEGSQSGNSPEAQSSNIETGSTTEIQQGTADENQNGTQGQQHSLVTASGPPVDLLDDSEQGKKAEQEVATGELNDLD